MLVDMVLGLIVVLFASVLSVTASEWQVVSKSTIDIKPGAGVVEATHQGGSSVCKFVYKAQGGTKEIWDFEYAENDEKELKCVVKRPSGSSYLFFEEFSLSADKGKVLSAYLEKQPEQVLPDHEYTIDHKKKRVHHVQGQFKSQLNKVELVFKKRPKRNAKAKSDL